MDIKNKKTHKKPEGQRERRDGKVSSPTSAPCCLLCLGAWLLWPGEDEREEVWDGGGADEEGMLYSRTRYSSLHLTVTLVDKLATGLRSPLLWL